MGGINAFTMLPDHVQLISVGQEKGISFWDLREPNPIAQIGMGSEQLCIDSFTPSNGETVFATAGVDGVVTLWAYKTQSPIGEGRGHSAAVRSLQFSPDGRQLVSVADDQAVLVWNIFLDDEEPLAPAPAPANAAAPA